MKPEDEASMLLADGRELSLRPSPSGFQLAVSDFEGHCPTTFNGPLGNRIRCTWPKSAGRWCDRHETASPRTSEPPTVTAAPAVAPIQLTEVSPNVPQPPPTEGRALPTWRMVVADMHARDDLGGAKYGVRHQHDNGRDHLVDCYQELLDAACYVRAEIERRKLWRRALKLGVSLIGFEEFCDREPRAKEFLELAKLLGVEP